MAAPVRGQGEGAAPLEVPELRRDTSPELLCDRSDLPVSIALTRSRIDSVGRAFDRHNTDVVLVADSLLRAGRFGETGSKGAIAGARLFVQLRSWNAMYTISNLTDLRGSVAQMIGSGHFLPFVDQYFNGAMYPLRHVDRAAVGEGAFCLRYEIPSGYDETFTYGSQKIRVRAGEMKNQRDETVPVLSREWMAGDGSKLELLFERSFTGRVARESIVDRGDRLDLVTFYDMDGLYVRKHGTHRLTAMAIWRSEVEGDELPERPRLGAAAYFPEIDIDLPWFLPDLGLEDLREFAYPPPLMSSRAFLDSNALPAWLGADAVGRFAEWTSHGPRPHVLDERFPDR